MSSEVSLPKIKVIDTRHLDGSAAGTSGVDSPSTTDGGTSARPVSATSSEGMSSFISLWTFHSSDAATSLPKMSQCYGFYFSLPRSR